MSPTIADQPTPTQAKDDLPPWLAKLRTQLLSMPGHALLLHGASGLGQYDLALSVAQAWLCEAPARNGNAEGRNESSAEGRNHSSAEGRNENSARGAVPIRPACGQCASCLQVHSRGHTDLVVLMPETLMIELGWPLTEKAQKEIDDKKRKPSKEIRIESVRDAVQFAELTSGRGRGKAIVVYPAEAMNHAAANALLKTLEEPLGSLRFVLATEAAHALLATIRSRCQAFALPQPEPQEALAWLTEKHPASSASQRETALRASGNRPLDALNSIALTVDSAWGNLPFALQKGQVQALASFSGAQLLDAQHKLCHDLWAIKLGALPRFYAPQDLPKPPPARALAAWSEQLKSLSGRIDHPFKQELLLEDMVQQAKLCINSRT